MKKRKSLVKQPITKGKCKVPVILQLEALECGAACLTMILAYYSKWIPLEKIRYACGVSRDGSNAINILKAARHYGLEAKGYRYEPEALKEKGTFPCIIHWNFNHFVVLNGFRNNRAYLNDPAKGNYSVPMSVFDESFTGICLMFKPTEQFVPSGKPKSVWKFIKKRMTGLKAPIVITVVMACLTTLVGLISPVFDKMFIDILLPGKNPEWFTPFIIGLLVIYIIQVLLAGISTAANYKINGKMSLVGNLSYMWKVLHLPMEFFSQRAIGDISSRQNKNANIANTIVNTLAPLFLDTIMMVFYFTVMIRYSWILTLVGVSSTIINFALSRYISKRRRNISKLQNRDQGKLSATTLAGIQMIETIKSSGAEEGFYEKWSGYYASINKTQQKYAKQELYLGIIPSAVTVFTSNIILGIGIYLTIKGQFTLGSITAFQGFFSSFMAPVTKLMAAGSTIDNMKVDMERIDDIMEYPDDPNVKDIEPKEGEEIAKLSGAVEIKNVTFGYSRLAEPLIKDFSMSIKAGSRVAFVGTSGCGKSTLSKLITGMYSPWSGDITFDGKHVNEIDHSIFTGSVAVVDQDIMLFEDTISNNIKMWDDSIEDYEMIIAAKDARMHDDIVAKPGGYQHKLIERGRDFSGGQRQRLEIARVLAQEPNIIILDEATSALDAKTEYEVVSAIKERDITCIVIAHRLSTIRDCDEIIVLDKGKVVERGTHDELMKLKGYYTKLVTND